MDKKPLYGPFEDPKAYDEFDYDSPFDEKDDEYSDHLNDISDGVGCTEIWEKLSEQRDNSEEILEE